MNCLYQKAINDNVLSNKCILDNVLWFHLECPKWIDLWDNPNYFKYKMRNYINEKIVTELKEEMTAERSVKQSSYNTFTYPEDSDYDKNLCEFSEKFEKDYHPQYNAEEYKIKRKIGFNSEKTPEEIHKTENMREKYWKALDADISKP